jgi:uncharacterized RDD family membrane protein YckC
MNQNTKQTPLHISGVTEDIYAGFGFRLISLILDIVILLPLYFLDQYIYGHGKLLFIFGILTHFLIIVWYFIFLVQKYGGTPGKLIVGIKIIKLNGEAITWTEAILRAIVSIIISILGTIISIMISLNIDSSVYNPLDFKQKTEYLKTIFPVLSKSYTWINNIWFWGELFVLLTNDRKRAIHDFIAGTVVVRAKYIEKIRETMNNPDGFIHVASETQTAMEFNEPNYSIGWFCLIPLIGGFVGIVLLLQGIFQYKDKKLVIIGVAGILFTVAIYSSIFFYERYGDAPRKGMAEFSQKQLNGLVGNIEYYKQINGHYPDSLQQISKSNTFVLIYDPIQASQGKSLTYNYKKLLDTYTLFSSGEDGIPNTKDDLFPQIAAANSSKVGYRKPQ